MLYVKSITILKISLLALVTTVVLSSCTSTKKVSFNNSTIVPGAEGTVKVKKDNNGNYHIEINFENLADSKKLTPPRSAYVVWMETKETGVKNIGQIHSASGMFSKAKKASIETVSASVPTRIFVTAEDDPKVEFAGPDIILTTDSF
jgi:hypothetical protein